MAVRARPDLTDPRRAWRLRAPSSRGGRARPRRTRRRLARYRTGAWSAAPRAASPPPVYPGEITSIHADYCHDGVG
jgi:hypothetical protein